MWDLCNIHVPNKATHKEKSAEKIIDFMTVTNLNSEANCILSCRVHSFHLFYRNTNKMFHVDKRKLVKSPIANLATDRKNPIFSVLNFEGYSS
jgi:hypothetical protein